MRRHCFLPLLAVLAGCTGKEAAQSSVDLNAAATRAEQAIDNYAATRPGADRVVAADLPTTAAARYRCRGAPDFTIEFDHVARSARVWLDSGPSVTLRQRRAASGIWYAADGYDLRGKGRDASFTEPGQPTTACRSG